MIRVNKAWTGVLVAGALAIAGCASSGGSASAPKPEKPAQQSAQTTTPAAKKAGADVAAISPQPGQGAIVFFRPSKMVGALISFKVREGEKELGKLTNGSYFVLDTTPGAHQYTVHSEAKDVLNLEVEAGQVYYVVGSISMGVLAGRPNLSPSDSATFESAREKMKRTETL